jgi:hypothetical protein
MSSYTDYIVPQIAAGLAIIPPFKGLIKKSALQKGVVSNITTLNALKEGVKTAPIVGAIVGTQMVLQNLIQNILEKPRKECKVTIVSSFGNGVISFGNPVGLKSTMLSSFCVGVISSPILAIFNGKTLGYTILDSCKRISAKQCGAIAIQETAFVGGLAASDLVAAKMKEKLGNNIVVKYAAVFLAGYMGSMAGHPANTALTRWQSGLPTPTLRQLMWGSATKARAVGIFAVLYHVMKENLM